MGNLQEVQRSEIEVAGRIFDNFSEFHLKEKNSENIFKYSVEWH